ncbi:MAG: twin-arginine translocation signal domain-containing protein, partial [Bacteroidales bacterium]|nr:twin-arginine translocation signal domain-containing protein [Bacteroidales bacterium]
MDRREFIKVSGAATAGIALTGCAPKGGAAKEAAVTGIPVPDYTGRITREIDKLKPLNIKEITVEVGA